MKKFFISAFLIAAVLVATRSDAQVVVSARVGFGVPLPVPTPYHRPYYAPRVVYPGSAGCYPQPVYAPAYRRYVPNCYRERHYWRGGRRW